MNIAIFASAFHPHLGGVEELVRQLALELRRQGHEAIVLTNRWPRNLPARETFEGIPLYRLAFRAPGAGPKSEVTFRLTSAALERQVRRILRRHAIEVVHVQCVSANGYYALRASLDMGLSLVVTVQGELTMDSTGLFERSAFARKTLRDCLSAAGMVTGCSERTLSDVESFVGGSFGERRRVIFNGASVDDFADAEPFDHARPYIFAMGRVVRQKGFDVLIRAFASMVPPTHDLLLAGDGPELPALQSLASSLGVAERVRFLGRADRKMVAGLFAGCEFFVLPSVADEGLPVVTAEAMAAGKAVIATRSGGAPEAVLDGITGLLVDKGDVEALGRAMLALVIDSARRDRLATEGRRRAREFSWPVIAEQYIDVYETARPGKDVLCCPT